MISLLKCPICGGTERSLLPSSVCEECGCDMKPDTSEARRVLFDKSQPKEARMAAMNVLQPKLAATPAPANPHIGSPLDDFLREEGIAPAVGREADSKADSAQATPTDAARVRDAEDARRYRFLRNDPPSSLCVRINREGCNALYTDGDNLDAAIDAALAAVEGRG